MGYLDYLKDDNKDIIGEVEKRAQEEYKDYWTRVKEAWKAGEETRKKARMKAADYKYDNWKYNFRERFLSNAGIGNAWELSWIGEQISSPITALFTPTWAEWNTKEDPNIAFKTLAWISDVWWKLYSYWLEKARGWKKLDEEEKDVAKQVWWDLILSLWGYGIGKWLKFWVNKIKTKNTINKEINNSKSSIKWLIWNLNDTKFTPSPKTQLDIEAQLNKHLDEEISLLDKVDKKDNIKKQIYWIVWKINDWKNIDFIKEVNKIASRNKINLDWIISDFNKTKSELYYKNHIYWNFLEGWKNIKLKNINLIKKDMINDWFSSASKKEKASFIKKYNNTYWKSNVDLVINKEKWKSFDKNLIYKLIEWNKAKNQWTGFKDWTWIGDIKYTELKIGLDRWLFEIKKWADGEKWFFFTKKWLDELWSHPKKIDWMENGFVHQNEKIWNKVVKEIENEKNMFNNQAVNELFKENETLKLNKIDDDVLRFHHLDEWDLNEIVNRIDEVNKTKKLWLDKDVEKALNSWLKEDLINLHKKFSTLKLQWFVTNKTYTNIASKWKGINTSLDRITGKLEDFNPKKIQLIRNQINKIVNDTKWKSWQALKQAQAKIEQLRFLQKAEEFKIKKKDLLNRRQKNILQKELKNIAKAKWLKTNFLDEFFGKKQWRDATSIARLKELTNKAKVKIGERYAKQLNTAIDKELTRISLSKQWKLIKAWNMDIDTTVALMEIKKIKNNMHSISIDKLEQLLSDVKQLKWEGRAKFKKLEDEWKLKISNNVKEIVKWLEWKKLVKELWDEWVDTYAKQIGAFMGSIYKSWLMNYRLIDEIFNFSEKAKQIYTYSVRNAKDIFERNEATKINKLLEMATNRFKDVKELEELWTILRARDYNIIDWVKSYEWLAKIIYNKNIATNPFYKKLDVPVEWKPKFLEDLIDLWDADDLMTWEKIRHTELWRILKKADDKRFSSFIEINDKIFDYYGRRIKLTAKEADNISMEVREKYFPDQIKWKIYSDIELQAWSAFWNKINRYIWKGWLKRKMAIEQIKKAWYEYETNYIKILMWNHKNMRYYADMQLALKEANQTYNWVLRRAWAFTPDELKWINDKEFFYNWEKVTVDLSTRNDSGKFEMTAWNNKLYIDLNEVDVKIWDWISSHLSKSERGKMEFYLRTIAQWWFTYATNADRIIAKLSNHFWVQALSWNIASSLKQPLSFFDAVPIVWADNLRRWFKDMKSKWMDEYLLKQPAIANRLESGWNFEVKQSMNDIKQWKVTSKIIKWYEKFVDTWMFALKHLDSYTFKRIWLAWLRKTLVDKKIIQIWDDITVDLLEQLPNKNLLFAEAVDLAERSAGSSNILMQPQLFRNAFSKAFFTLMSTQMNRVQNIVQLTPRMINDIKKWKPWAMKDLVVLHWMFLTSNYLEWLIWMEIGKKLYDMWAETWTWYNNEQADILFSKDMIINSTLWQLPVWSIWEKIISWRPNIALKWVWNVWKDFLWIKDEIMKWELGWMVKWMADMLIDWFGTKAWKYLKNWLSE